MSSSLPVQLSHCSTKNTTTAIIPIPAHLKFQTGGAAVIHRTSPVPAENGLGGKSSAPPQAPAPLGEDNARLPEIVSHVQLNNTSPTCAMIFAPPQSTKHINKTRHDPYAQRNNGIRTPIPTTPVGIFSQTPPRWYIYDKNAPEGSSGRFSPVLVRSPLCCPQVPDLAHSYIFKQAWQNPQDLAILHLQDPSHWAKALQLVDKFFTTVTFYNPACPFQFQKERSHHYSPLLAGLTKAQFDNRLKQLEEFVDPTSSKTKKSKKKSNANPRSTGGLPTDLSESESFTGKDLSDADESSDKAAARRENNRKGPAYQRSMPGAAMTTPEATTPSSGNERSSDFVPMLAGQITFEYGSLVCLAFLLQILYPTSAPPAKIIPVFIKRNDCLRLYVHKLMVEYVKAAHRCALLCDRHGWMYLAQTAKGADILRSYEMTSTSQCHGGGCKVSRYPITLEEKPKEEEN